MTNLINVKFICTIYELREYCLQTYSTNIFIFLKNHNNFPNFFRKKPPEAIAPSGFATIFFRNVGEISAVLLFSGSLHALPSSLHNKQQQV